MRDPRVVVTQELFDAVVYCYPLHPFPPKFVRRWLAQLVFRVPKGENRRPWMTSTTPG